MTEIEGQAFEKYSKQSFKAFAHPLKQIILSHTSILLSKSISNNTTTQIGTVRHIGPFFTELCYALSQTVIS